MRAAFPLSIARPISLYTPLPLSGTTTALVCSRKKQRCIYSGREEGERWGEGALLVYFGAVLLNPMQKRKSLLRCLKRQMGPAFDAAFWVTSGGRGDAGREAGNSGRVAVTAAHLKFQKVTSHPWHIRSICMRKQRTAGQGDGGDRRTRGQRKDVSRRCRPIRQRSQFSNISVFSLRSCS